jgi:hypothetical protein
MSDKVTYVRTFWTSRFHLTKSCTIRNSAISSLVDRKFGHEKGKPPAHDDATKGDKPIMIFLYTHNDKMI